MRKRRTPIGEILVGLGRISPGDVERALAYQREWGGYFGDALVALELVTPAEVKWGLADQYDLPFVNLHPDSIDRAVAARVPASWAREHLVLPILRDEEKVTVVLADPRDLGMLAEVQHFTGATHVEAALSTPATIRTLIDAVHGAPDVTPVSLLRFLAEALESGAEEVGVSVRRGRSQGWSRRHAVAHRVLEGDPLPELRRAVSPFPEGGGKGVRRWTARIAVAGSRWAAECHAVGDGDTLEWVARITGEESRQEAPARVGPELRAEVALALRRGPVLVRVEGERAEAVERALPLLPALLLEREPRAAHVSDRGAPPEGVVHLPAGESLRETLEALLPFALDALTLDVGEASPAELRMARRVAPLAAVRLRSGGWAEEADFHLRLEGGVDSPEWERDGTD